MNQHPDSPAPENTGQAPGPSHNAEPPAPRPAPKFVVVYDVQDQPLCDRLNNHLYVLKTTKKIQVYNVHKAPAGADVEGAAREQLANADYLLCLITPRLFRDDTPWFGMVLEALEQNRRVIPLKLDKMNIDGTGLEKLRSLPTMDRTVSDFPNADAAFADIAEELKRLAGK